MTEQTPTIFIIDDDPSARRGLSRLIRVAGFSVRAFASAQDFLASQHCKGPGCIVLDVQMPGLSGLDLQAELNKTEYNMPIIFISAHGDVPMTAQAMKDGALDFLTKPVDRDQLLNAIRGALARDQAAREEHAELEQIRARLARLTPREFEVMTFVLAGQLNKQIAYKLGITEDTVKIHRGRMMTKIGVVSVAELVRLTQKAGVEPADPGRK
ncbi:MAG: response regulator transcription factor [Sedimentisphaerales bacterium]|nr:response regulator transcription factor [Sedimentisphaerales bacterium]